MTGGNYFGLFPSDTGKENLGLLFQLFQDTLCSVWQEGKNAFHYWRNERLLLSPTKPMHFSTLCTFFDNISLFVVLLLVPEDILDGPLCLLNPPDI